MIEQVASPSVQHRQAGQLAAHILWVPGQFLQRRGGAAQQQTIESFLMGINQRAQFRGQGEGQEVVSAG